MTPSELTDRLLALRGITDADARETFLHPKYDMLHDPFLMHDMSNAVVRILSAIENNEKICIYSDYDADGIPGAVILHDFFKKIGYENFCNYIPHRHNEGYGLHIPAIEKMVDEGAKLMITVDLGITAVAEVLHANGLGLDVIVTDHHEPLEVLPPAFAIVNPKLGNYPDKMLCGAGVVFKLVQALLKKINIEPVGWEKWLLDMAGLATLSDMVPLQNENRIIAYFGMKVLQKTGRPGLRALFEKSGISLDHLVEEDITFSITPKLNAAGRMAHPMDAFNALATTERRAAMIAAEHLAKLNDERKKIVARIMRDVHKRVVARKTSGDLKKILVIGDPSWPAGILGLVASKIIEEYVVTTFVWGAESSGGILGESDGDILKGSARGVGDVGIVQLMQGCSQLLTQFGGHADAGGFSTTREHIHFLEEAFCKEYENCKKEAKEETEEKGFDLELELSDVTIANYRALRELAPFGVGNPKPIFAFKNVTVVSCRQFGKTTEHLEVFFVAGGGVSRPPLPEGAPREAGGGVSKVKAISWFATADSFSEKIESGKSVTLLAEFDFSVFRGKSELRLKIVDILNS